MGVNIWHKTGSWEGSQPFLDRYVFQRVSGPPPVIVDEVNWWPLLFPLKCQILLVPEADNLAGVDEEHLRYCAADPTLEEVAKDPGRYYPWIDRPELNRLLAGKPRSGGGVWLNRSLKAQIMNWGLSDAVIALGPMRWYFRQAMEKAFADSERATPNADFVVISESLGSFIVMDAFDYPNKGDGAVARVLDRTTDLYFFANQFPLLELGRLEGAPASFGITAGGRTTTAPTSSLLQRWAARRPSAGPVKSGEAAPAAPLPERRQVVAFSDPSDLLTFFVPQLLDENGKEIKVLNLYDRNAFRWFGSFEDPAKAHTGHSRNPAVLQWMFRKSHGPARRAGPAS